MPEVVISMVDTMAGDITEDTAGIGRVPTMVGMDIPAAGTEVTGPIHVTNGPTRITGTDGDSVLALAGRILIGQPTHIRTAMTTAEPWPPFDLGTILPAIIATSASAHGMTMRLANLRAMHPKRAARFPGHPSPIVLP